MKRIKRYDIQVNLIEYIYIWISELYPDRKFAGRNGKRFDEMKAGYKLTKRIVISREWSVRQSVCPSLPQRCGV